MKKEKNLSANRQGVIGYVQPHWKEQIAEPEGCTLLRILAEPHRYFSQKVKIIWGEKGVTILDMEDSYSFGGRPVYPDRQAINPLTFDFACNIY